MNAEAIGQAPGEAVTGAIARAAKHAALADPARLVAVDHLAHGDASPSELQALLGLPSNLVAHHLRVLEDAGIARRRRSEGDRRRTYVALVPGGLEGIATPAAVARRDDVRRVLFVCSANSARSQLASALWSDVSTVPSASAGTRPAPRVAPGARAAAERHGLRLVDDTPRALADVLDAQDLVVTVCDSAHEELDGRDDLHWAVPDPVPLDSADVYDDVVVDLGRRIATLARATAG